MNDSLSNEVEVQDEMTSLKTRADLMGVPYHVSIGLDKLREKVNAHLVDTQTPVVSVAKIDAPVVVTVGVGATVEELIEGYHAAVAANLSPAQKRSEALKECNRLVRIQINCLNPIKRDWPGETFEVSNSVVGTFKKYVPFDNTAGYHVPHIILQAIQERQCQIFVNGTDASGNPTKRAKVIKEFAVQILPSLTQVEIKELAQRQLMADGAQNQ